MSELPRLGGSLAGAWSRTSRAAHLTQYFPKIICVTPTLTSPRERSYVAGPDPELPVAHLSFLASNHDGSPSHKTPSIGQPSIAPGAGYLAATSGRDGDHFASGRFGSGMTLVFCAEAICHLRPALAVTSDITPRRMGSVTPSMPVSPVSSHRMWTTATSGRKRCTAVSVATR
jgi:hypothetical protein